MSITHNNWWNNIKWKRKTNNNKLDKFMINSQETMVKPKLKLWLTLIKIQIITRIIIRIRIVWDKFNKKINQINNKCNRWEINNWILKWLLKMVVQEIKWEEITIGKPKQMKNIENMMRKKIWRRLCSILKIKDEKGIFYNNYDEKWFFSNWILH